MINNILVLFFALFTVLPTQAATTPLQIPATECNLSGRIMKHTDSEGYDFILNEEKTTEVRIKISAFDESLLRTNEGKRIVAKLKVRNQDIVSVVEARFVSVEKNLDVFDDLTVYTQEKLTADCKK